MELPPLDCYENAVARRKMLLECIRNQPKVEYGALYITESPEVKWLRIETATCIKYLSDLYETYIHTGTHMIPKVTPWEQHEIDYLKASHPHKSYWRIAVDLNRNPDEVYSRIEQAKNRARIRRETFIRRLSKIGEVVKQKKQLT